MALLRWLVVWKEQVRGRGLARGCWLRHGFEVDIVEPMAIAGEVGERVVGMAARRWRYRKPMWVAT